MPVGELLGRLSSRELTEWMAFAKLEPFGAGWENLMAALSAYVDTMINTAPVDRETVSLQDFLLLDREEDQEPDEDIDSEESMVTIPSVMPKLKGLRG